MATPNKRRRLDYHTTLEDLPNELFWEIFELIDAVDLYRTFFHLKQRFRQLIDHPPLRLRLEITSISAPTFSHYFAQHIQPNSHRVKSLYTTNPCSIIQLDPSIFPHLETLILHNVTSQQVQALLHPKLVTLSISTLNCPEYKSDFYEPLFDLPALKHLTVCFDDDWRAKAYWRVADRPPSRLEYLWIKSRCYLFELEAYLARTPQLQSLICDDLRDHNGYPSRSPTLPAIQLTHLSLRLHGITFDQWETLVKNSIDRLEVLRLATSDDHTFLNANRWERLISDQMRHLRVFDIQHTNFAFDNRFIESSCETLMSHFATPFWSERNWFFGHQHSRCGHPNNAIFYSIRSWNGGFYELKQRTDYGLCPISDDSHSASVRHLLLADQMTVRCNAPVYFPHVTQLTLGKSLLIDNYYLQRTLERFLSLRQVQKINFQDTRLHYDRLIAMLELTPNCQTVVLNALEGLPRSNERLHLAPSISTVRRLVIRRDCRLRAVQLANHLFPSLECLILGTSDVLLQSIVGFLAAKKSTDTSRLTSVRFLYMQRLLELIKREVTKNYTTNEFFVEAVGSDCFLWW